MNTTARLAALTLPLALAATHAEPASAQTGFPESGFEVGAPFPTVSLPSLEDGRPMSIADFRGQKIILHIFASW